MRHDINYTVEWGKIERKRQRERMQERVAIVALHLATVLFVWVLCANGGW